MLSLFVVAFVGLLSLALPAHAIVDTIAGLIAQVVLAIASLLGKLLLVVIGIMIGIAQYNDFVNVEAIITGWVIVRDVSNMFFIMVLLVIAFGTILRIEQYRYNRLLGKLILMAILINLSKFIAGFFIDVGQVIMLTFVNGFKDAAAGNFTSMFNLKQMLKFRDTTEPPTGSEFLGASILALAFILIALIVMVIMVVVLVIRIIMLWILVVLSPLAYILAVFPGSAKYASQWWSSFWKYVMVGPILAFFVWLALTVTTTTTSSFVASVDDKISPPDVSQAVNVSGSGLAASVSQASDGSSILSFVIGIAMLMGALMVTQQLGGIAGNLAGKAASAIQKGGAKAALAPFAAARSLTGYGTRQLYRHTGVQLNPKHIVQGVRENFKKRSIQDMEAGRVKAGEALVKGGSIANTIKGFTGATEDFSDYNFRGFLGSKGLLGEKVGGKLRAGRIFRGMKYGSEEVAAIRDEIKGKREDIKKRKAALEQGITLEDQEAAAQEIARTQSDAGSLSKAIDTNQFSEEHLPMFQDMLERVNEQIEDIPSKPDEQSDEQKEELAKLKAQQAPLQEFIKSISHFDKVIDSTKKHLEEIQAISDKATVNSLEAGRAGDTALEQSELATVRKYQPDIAVLKSALKDIEDNRKEGNIQAILDKGSLGDIAKIFQAAGKKDLANEASGLHIARQARIEQAAALRKQGNDLYAGNTTGVAYWQGEASRLAQVADRESVKVGIKPELLSTWREQLQENLKMMQGQLDENEEGSLMFQLRAKPFTDDMKKNVEASIEKLNAEIKVLNLDAIAKRGPQAFYAQRGRRALAQEESRKMTTTNEDELITNGENALRSGNDLQFAAVALQAARASHMNEILNAFSTDDIGQYIDKATGEYKDKTPWGEEINPDHAPVDKGGNYNANQAGLNAFVRDIMIKKLHMAEQDALSIQNDISNILEQNNHWFGGQSIGNEDGLFTQRKPDDQQTRTMIEMSKRDEEKLLREGNRLAWTTEGWIDPKDQSKGRVSKLNAVGIWMLDTKHRQITQNLPRGRFNKNMAMNLMSPYNWKVIEAIYMKKAGDDKKQFGQFMKKIRLYAGKAQKEQQTDLSSQVQSQLDYAKEIEDSLRI